MSPTAKSRLSIRQLVAVLAALLGMCACPVAASAHGPIDPPASKYLARVSSLPAGLRAIVVDGDQRLWLRSGTRQTIVVLDYRGAPYLRFSGAGVQVNEASSMYYLNQVPAQIPPANLTPGTTPDWHRVSDQDSYEWHDGRLHALAVTALQPGSDFVGRWSIPLRIGGVAAVIEGRLLHAPDPPLVWFWPIIVAVACVPAAVRLRRSELDDRLACGLSAVALTAFAVTGAGLQLHGRPNISAGQLIVLGLELAFVAWGFVRLARRRHGWFQLFLVAAAAIWQGASQTSVLLDGFVLVALPPLVARIAVVACLAGGLGLLPVVFAMAERSGRRRPRPASDRSGDEAAGRVWEPSA